MRIRFGFDLVYSSAEPVPVIAMLHAQPRADQTLLKNDDLIIEPHLPSKFYRDPFGNGCTRFVTRPGSTRLTADGVIEDPGCPEETAFDACEVPVSELPDDALSYLLPSRYCETEVLMADAWRLFGAVEPGWQRVQAVCDFVHRHVTFGYAYARCTKTACETFREGRGVCRDFAHLAITFCRCLNIPARYCTTYLGDIGVQPVDAAMDFAGCMEVFLGGRWHVFDPRNNARRIGRIMVARGRDAADVAISTAFGSCRLTSFKVWTDQLAEGAPLPLSVPDSQAA